MKRFLKYPLVVAYGLTMAIWIVYAATLQVKSLWYTSQGKGGESVILPSQMELVALVEQKPFSGLPKGDWLVSSDSDPQIRWKCNGWYLEQVQLNMETLWPTGAVVLYYRTAQQPDFLPTQMVYAKQTQQGTYVFQLPGVMVEEIRIDPASQGGVILQVEGMETKSNGVTTFVPSWQQGALLLGLPPVGVALWSLLPRKKK